MPEAKISENKNLSEYDITLHGEHYHIKVAGFGTPHQGSQTCFLWVDGVPEEVVIQGNEGNEFENHAEVLTQTLTEGDISVSIPGTVMAISVKVGDKVKKGQKQSLVIEAMKMETEVQASEDGIVKELHCHKGDKVIPGQILLHLDLKK